ncbi:hypothetical protein ACFWN2_39230 [Lentzea sp. NPDC058436]|uniref:hypothetical protein n=1 Tax=Lentzea sp. NPDC058436 TaxID=3346499 RepID=UPI0036546146
MAIERPDAGPAAHDAHDWATFPSKLIILCFVRTYVSAIRLYQEMKVFEGDPHVKLVWVRCPGSKLEDPLSDWLLGKGIRVIPYEEAKKSRRDLIVTTSEWIDPIPFAPTPVIVIPHGLGFHKYVRDPHTGRYRLAGLARPEGLRTKQVTQVVTHEDQVRQLAEASPHTIGRTALGGCSDFDLLTNSRGERPDYREALGVSSDQRLVVVSSTWGPDSLFARRPELIDRLLAELPFELYKIAVILHPGVWSIEGGDEVLRRLSRHIQSGGLMVVPTTEGWHGTLLAADLAIGDNGTVSLQAALMDIPLLLGTVSKRVVRGTVMDELCGTARSIDFTGGLRRQVEDEIGKHDRSRAERLVRRMIARPGESGSLLRALCYTTAGHTAPDDELPVRTAPLPVPMPSAAHSFRFHFRIDSAVTGDLYPAHFREKLKHDEERLLVQIGERDHRRHANASVIVDPVPVLPCAVQARLATLADKHVGCRIVAATCGNGGFEFLVRDGRRFRVTCDCGMPVRVLAAACYEILVVERELSGEFVVRTSLGDAKMTVVPL